MLLDDLKKKYDSAAIGEIETKCEKFSRNAASNRKDLILTLYYLERTRRFRENPVYKSASFKVYLMDKHNLREWTYNKERFAFIAHPEAAAKWGPGLVSKIQTECGADKVPDVVKKIEETKGVNRLKIDKIIKANSKPKADQAPVGPTKSEIEAESQRRMQTIAEYIQQIKEKDEQIDKLKLTVHALNEENAKLKETIKVYRQREEQLRNVFGTVPVAKTSYMEAPAQ